MENSNDLSLIAPCGMNCGICIAYLRDKNKCPGCRGLDINSSKCKQIKHCPTFENGKAQFCFECEKFPCSRLKHLDERYQTKYNMSIIENLENIKKFGLKEFVANEKVRWKCPECGGTICVHRGYCHSCGKKK
ncbi:DUF3795 domain-containing protein [Methanococcoides sp. SA1]|nr:DUF3795 domain-containing protein [Methanococcoides sp. SA1]